MYVFCCCSSSYCTIRFSKCNLSVEQSVLWTYLLFFFLIKQIQQFTQIFEKYFFKYFVKHGAGVRTGTGDYERSEPETPVVLQCPNWPCDNAMSMVSTIMWGNVRWCLAFDKQNKFVFISLWSIVSWCFSINDSEDNFSNGTQILFPT